MPSQTQTAVPQRGTQRTPFSESDDLFLVQYLSIETPNGSSRKGNGVYKDLEQVCWRLSTLSFLDSAGLQFAKSFKDSGVQHHPWQGWRERYVRYAADFDHRISIYQRRYNIDPNSKSPQSDLWDALPLIRPEDVKESTGSKETQQRAVGSRVPKDSPQRRRVTATAKRRPLRKVQHAKGLEFASENSSESDDQQIPPPRAGKRRAMSTDDDEEAPSRKRRRLQEKQASQEGSAEEEGERTHESPPGQERAGTNQSRGPSPLGEGRDETNRHTVASGVPPTDMYFGEIFETAREASQEVAHRSPNAAETALTPSEQPILEDDLSESGSQYVL